MPQFRLTQKYAKDARISALSDPLTVVSPLDDWFIDVMRVNRKKIAMVTHAQSTFTLLIPYTKVGGAIAIPSNIGILLKEFLCKHNLSKWVGHLNKLFSEPIRFCKTGDRKILGHMNDFKRCVERYTEHSPQCVHPINWHQVAGSINNMPVNFSAANKYIYPIEMLGKLIGHELRST